MGHADGNIITTHYSAAELQVLICAVDKIQDQGIAQTSTRRIVKRTIEKGCRECVGFESRVSRLLLANPCYMAHPERFELPTKWFEAIGLG